MTFKEVLSFTGVYFFDDTEDVVDFEALLDGIEKDAHKLLNILLLEALAVVPLEAACQLIGHREGCLGALKCGEELLELIYDTVFLRGVDGLVVPKVTLKQFVAYLHL